MAEGGKGGRRSRKAPSSSKKAVGSNQTESPEGTITEAALLVGRALRRY